MKTKIFNSIMMIITLGFVLMPIHSKAQPKGNEQLNLTIEFAARKELIGGNLKS